MRACPGLVSLVSLVPLVAGAVSIPRIASAVEGGVEDRVTTHAVSIATGGPQSPAVRCSGTLVSPNVVLTVRHCIARIPADRPSCDATFPAPPGAPNDFWIDATPWVLPSSAWKSVSSWILPERAEVCGNDVALLVLAEPFSRAQATPARPIVTEAAFRSAVSTRRMGLAAFGASSASAADSGTRRSRFDIPVQCVPGDQSFACGGALEYIDVREFTGGAGPCAGDSGAGAILTADRETIFGVLSRGNPRGGCSEGVFERTDVWGWLIAKTVIDATPRGETPPSWARDAFPSKPQAGQFCRVAADCGALADCVSFDGRRSFTCAARCSAEVACAAGFHCESGVCAPGEAPLAADSGCSAAAMLPPSPSTTSVGAMIVIGAIFLRRSGIVAIEDALLRTVGWLRRLGRRGGRCSDRRGRHRGRGRDRRARG
jgi:hypothetical protein